jgi:sulfur carrier protein
MQLKVNGAPAEIPDTDSISVNEVLSELKVSDPLYVTVELNGEILDRATFDATHVKDGDTVEFLYFMGGGSR